MQNLIIYLVAVFCRYALDSKDGYRSGLLQGTEALTSGRTKIVYGLRNIIKKSEL